MSAGAQDFFDRRFVVEQMAIQIIFIGCDKPTEFALEKIFSNNNYQLSGLKYNNYQEKCLENPVYLESGHFGIMLNDMNCILDDIQHEVGIVHSQHRHKPYL